MIKLDYIPEGLEEIIEYYGDPRGDGWYEENITVFTLPFNLVLSWDESISTRRVAAHRLVAESMKDALMEIASKFGERFHREELDRFGGTYNNRSKRDRAELSTHAWGIAIDYLPEHGRLGSEDDVITYPQLVVDAFEERGWYWGGRFSRPDAMHFQACIGY